MERYIRLQIEVTEPGIADILIGQLSELGFHGFEETGQVLLAYCSENLFPETETHRLLDLYQLRADRELFEEQNWNAVWEQNFQPVQVGNMLTIRADFHPVATDTAMEIIIVPKMSFGTGHHATTYLMIQEMMEIGFQDKTVLDFGTGTGILSILAEKKGALKIVAADIDDWSIQNARENFQLNQCTKIELVQTGFPVSGQKYDIVLANITRDVILKQLPALVRCLEPGGTLLLSGLLRENEEEICRQAVAEHLKRTQMAVRDTWISLRFEN